jgi:hypothetical protein
VDSDGDGIVDCLDLCPQDPKHIVPGQCGCIGEDNLTPAGTACTDGLCSVNDECDGQGSCGSPDECSPRSDCEVKEYSGHAYAFCYSDEEWSDARAVCQSLPNMDIVRIDTAEEDEFVHENLPAPAWIGANDQVTEGQWVWADTEQAFWMGDDDGEAAPGQYANWYGGEPDGSYEDCGLHKKHANAWRDRPCHYDYDFVCEADRCPDDPAKSAPGQCGCSTPDADSDGDGTPDCLDQCPDDPARTVPDALGCADVLDATASELAEKKRRLSNTSIPDAERPTVIEVKTSAKKAVDEVLRVIAGVPSDLDLRSDSDLRPWVASLGRAWSTMAIVRTPPTGALPDGTLCPDRLEATTVDAQIPVLSRFFSHIPYQDDDAEMTRALYRLADVQNFLRCLNRDDIARVDRGLTESLLFVMCCHRSPGVPVAPESSVPGPGAENVTGSDLGGIV